METSFHLALGSVDTGDNLLCRCFAFVLPLLSVYMALCLPLVIVDDSPEMETQTITKEELKSESI